MPKTILVVGASSDVGLVLSRRLLASDDTSTVIAHSFSGNERIALLKAEFGDRVFPIQADLSNEAAVSEMIGQVNGQFGTPDQIVYLPALRLTYERLTKFNLERFRQDMAIQVEAPVIFLKQFAAKMGKMEGSRFVFVLSSVVSGMPPKFMSMYTIAKYAQLGLMRAAAAEYASTHLTVNAIAPGMVDTQFLADIAETAVQMAAAANPKGRNAKPEDLMAAMEFLLSPGAGYITGSVLPITGGSGC